MRKTFTLFSILLALTSMGYQTFAQVLFKDIVPGAHPSSSSPSSFMTVNGTLFFQVTTGNPAKHQIWKTDGTSGNTVKVKDSVTVTNLGNTVTFQTSMNGFLYYTVSTSPATTTELWKTDGTVTSLVATFNYQSGKGIAPTNFIVAGGKLFFQMAIDNGLELWVSDGTSGGTNEVINLDPGSSAGTQYNGTRPSPMAAYNNKVYFAGATSLGDYELYTSDGTAAGTVLTKDLAPGTAKSGTPQEWLIHNGDLYFTAYDGTITSLWKTNGTTVTQISSAVNAAAPLSFKGNIYYRSGIDIWKTDGTNAGTEFVADSALIGNFNGANADYFFSSYAKFKPVYPYYDYFYYKSDGTTAGTVAILKEEYDRASFIVLNNKMYNTLVENISLYTGAMWETDGTSDSTKVIVGYTGLPYIYNNKVYFSYYTSATGYELWVYDPAAVTTGVTKISLNETVQLYPNPSSGKVNVLNASELNAVYTVYNSSGEKILETMDEKSIDLSSQPKGIYVVHIKTDKDNCTRKILIQ